MDINFITNLAWVFGILATLLTLWRWFSAVKYLGGNGQLIDQLNGSPLKTFRSTIPMSVAIVCWIWIFTYY